MNYQQHKSLTSTEMGKSPNCMCNYYILLLHHTVCVPKYVMFKNIFVPSLLIKRGKTFSSVVFYRYDIIIFVRGV